MTICPEGRRELCANTCCACLPQARPLVGRDGEVAELRHCLRQALAGERLRVARYATATRMAKIGSIAQRGSKCSLISPSRGIQTFSWWATPPRSGTESRCQESRQPAPRPFSYVDKGNMAVVGKGFAVLESGRLRISGFLAWLAWAAVHLQFLGQSSLRISVFLQCVWTF